MSALFHVPAPDDVVRRRGRLGRVAYSSASVAAPGGPRGAGGDWVDVASRDDGRVVAVLGDVAGHGPAAVPVMRRLRTAAGHLVDVSRSPAEVLERLDAHAAGVPDHVLSTVCVVFLDLGAWTVEWASAGHIQPLCVAGRAAWYLPASADPPLGTGSLARRRASWRTVLPPGVSHLVLVSDGAVERRGASLEVGLERLRCVAASGPPDGERLADVLFDTFRKGSPDDVAVLVLTLG